MSEKKEPNFRFKGRVVAIEATQTFASGFSKRTMVLDNTDEGDKYGNPVPFTFTKDHCEDLDGIAEGMVVEVAGWFSGRGWDNPKTGKRQYFCDNTVYSAPKVISTPARAAAPSEPEPSPDTVGDSEDLPF